MPDPGGYRGKRTPAKSSSAARGLGYEHRPNRERMFCSHLDGAVHHVLAESMPLRTGMHLPQGRLCAPMYRHPALNLDGLPLTADDWIGRSRDGLKADRLVLAADNRSRGARDRGDRYAAPWWAREWTGGGQLAC
jgi:hypothetical protein